MTIDEKIAGIEADMARAQHLRARALAAADEALAQILRCEGALTVLRELKGDG